MSTATLTARASARPKSRPRNWKVSRELNARRQIVTEGTEVAIVGWRGRAKFVEHVDNGTDEWITVFYRNGFRSCDPGRIRRVYKMTVAQKEQAALRAYARAKAAEQLEAELAKAGQGTLFDTAVGR